jgi:hypothetical protein
MAQEPLTAKLANAATNVRKLCEFFVARRDWRPAADAGSILVDLEAATNRLRARLDGVLLTCGAGPASPAAPAMATLGPDVFDTGRLQKLTTYLHDLEAWFAAQPAPPSEPEAVALISEMSALVGAMALQLAGAAAPTAAVAPPTAASAAPPAAAPVAVRVEPRAAPPAGDPGHAARTTAGPPPRQLVLDDTEEAPLIQEFQGRKELTATCEKLADDFLSAWDIQLSYYNRKKFLERLLRWISSAPEGQVLVIKMKTVEEPYEPYPSYIAREILQGKQP